MSNKTGMLPTDWALEVGYQNKYRKRIEKILSQRKRKKNTPTFSKSLAASWKNKGKDIKYIKAEIREFCFRISESIQGQTFESLAESLSWRNRHKSKAVQKRIMKRIIAKRIGKKIRKKTKEDYTQHLRKYYFSKGIKKCNSILDKIFVEN